MIKLLALLCHYKIFIKHVSLPSFNRSATAVLSLEIGLIDIWHDDPQ